jgi:hypothetical protein
MELEGQRWTSLMAFSTARLAIGFRHRTLLQVDSSASPATSVEAETDLGKF